METIKRWLNIAWKRLKKINIVMFKSSNSVISYKDKLQKLNILPLSLYQQLHVVLLFAEILSGKIDIDWQNEVILAGGRKLPEISCASKCSCRKGIRFLVPSLLPCKSALWFFFKYNFLFDPDQKQTRVTLQTILYVPIQRVRPFHLATCVYLYVNEP